MIRYAIYLFVGLSLINAAEKLLSRDWAHLGVASVLVFMSVSAWILSLGE